MPSLACLAAATAFGLLLSPARADGGGTGGTVYATPHDMYSSSIGVPGCKVNTNRIAYWPSSVSCTSICVQLSYQGRSVKLLRVDQSQGAHDVSYDAWNYLISGQGAETDPQMGGQVAMEYSDLPPEDCADLIYTDGGKLPLSASNSMNFLSSCIADGGWVGTNYVLYNILDPICSWGFDEECSLDLATSNQPSCPHTLGLTVALTTAPVYDIQYGTGLVVAASSGQVVKGIDVDSESGASSARPSISSALTTALTGYVSTAVSAAALPTTLTTLVLSSMASRYSSKADVPTIKLVDPTGTPALAEPIASTASAASTAGPAEFVEGVNSSESAALPTSVPTPTPTLTPTWTPTPTPTGLRAASRAVMALWSRLFLVPVLDEIRS